MTSGKWKPTRHLARSDGVRIAGDVLESVIFIRSLTKRSRVICRNRVWSSDIRRATTDASRSFDSFPIATGKLLFSAFHYRLTQRRIRGCEPCESTVDIGTDIILVTCRSLDFLRSPVDIESWPLGTEFSPSSSDNYTISTAPYTPQSICRTSINSRTFRQYSRRLSVFNKLVSPCTLEMISVFHENAIFHEIYCLHTCFFRLLPIIWTFFFISAAVKVLFLY